MSKSNNILTNLATAVLLFLFVVHYGMQQFGAYDCSTIVDIGWRIHNGQIPYTGFPTSFPIGFVVGCGYAFALFGVKWKSIVLLTAVFSAVTFLWSSFMLNEITSDPDVSWLLSLAIQAVTSCVMCFWWYNSMTSILCCTFIMAAIVFANNPSRWLNYSIALALLMTCKPQCAGLLILGVTIFLLRRDRIVLSTIIGILLFVGFCSANALDVLAVAKSYLAVSARLLSLDKFRSVVDPAEMSAGWFTLVVSLLPLLACRPRWSATTAVCLCGIATGLVAFISNGELKLVDVSICLCSSVLLFYEKKINPA